MSVSEYNIPSQLKGVNGFGLDVDGALFSAKLAAATELTLAFPGGAANGTSAPVYNRYCCIINATTPVWVSINQTAAVPAGAAFAATTSILLPAGQSGLTGKAGDVLHFISEEADNSVSVRFNSYTA